MEMNIDGSGITGGYEISDPEVFRSFLEQTLRPVEQNQSRKRRQSAEDELITGIENPVTCITTGDVIGIMVEASNFPVYDSDNTLNTNENFDYGGFRELEEILGQMQGSSEFFTFR